MSVSSTDVSASVRSEFDFNVDKFPLFGPDHMPTDQYGLFRDDTGYLKGVKSVSPRYVPHTTDDVCALVDAAGEAFDGEIACDTHFRNGHYVFFPLSQLLNSVPPFITQPTAITFSLELLLMRVMMVKRSRLLWATSVMRVVISP